MKPEAELGSLQIVNYVEAKEVGWTSTESLWPGDMVPPAFLAFARSPLPNF